MQEAKEIHPDLLDRIERAFLRLDAALPTIQMTLQHLGDTDEAREFALAKWALETAHEELKPVFDGTA